MKFCHNISMETRSYYIFTSANKIRSESCNLTVCHARLREHRLHNRNNWRLLSRPSPTDHRYLLLLMPEKERV
ncbi:glycoprotein A33 (transmembrane), paralog a [Tachysurus ichikawai]